MKLADIRHVALLPALALAFSVNAQTARKAPEPTAAASTIRATTSLVLVDVVATKEGVPVHGLARNIFHVFEDGQEQKITTFDEHTAPVLQDRQPGAAAGDRYTNIARSPAGTAINVILLDRLNTPADAQANGEAQLYSFLENARPGTPTEVFELDARLHLMVGFNEEPAELARTLKLAQMNPRASILNDPEGEKHRAEIIGETSTKATKDAPQLVEQLKSMEALMNSAAAQDRVGLTLAAFADLARLLELVPGRKNLIWISGSFPITIEPDLTAKDPFNAWQSFEGEVSLTAKRLAAAQVAIYPIDAEGLTGLPSANAINRYNDASGYVDQNHIAHVAGQSDDMKFLAQSADERSTLRRIAGATGGKAFVNTNGIAGAIASAQSDGANYYSLGYVPAKAKLDGKYHSLKVKIDGASYHLAYRRAYLADAQESAAKEREAKVPALLASLMLGAPPATQIGLVARVIAADSKEAEGVVLDDQMPGATIPSSQDKAWRRYLALLLIDTSDVVFDLAADGTRTTTVELAVIGYDGYGKPLNEIERHVNLKIPAEDFARELKGGLPVRFALNLPVGFSFLRIAVHDPKTGRVGSVELPVAVAGKGQ